MSHDVLLMLRSLHSIDEGDGIDCVIIQSLKNANNKNSQNSIKINQRYLITTVGSGGTQVYDLISYSIVDCELFWRNYCLN